MLEKRKASQVYFQLKYDFIFLFLQFLWAIIEMY